MSGAGPGMERAHASPLPAAASVAVEAAPAPRTGLALLLWLVLVAAALASELVWPAFAVAGLMATGLLWPGLKARHRGALGLFALWLALSAAAGWHGGAPMVLALLPAQATAVLAWLFARTLRSGRTPLVALAVAAIDGPARLEVPGLRAYARGVTLGWAIACACLALLALVAARVGGTAGLAVHLAMPLATLALFLGEYHWRRRRFADLPHPPFGRFLWQLAGRWNPVVRVSFGEEP